ncbi:MAG: pyrophosphatase PpaX [Thomasclavelia sp.]|nr:pyrophosphatase PpaX [Thomasclavelia sp.]
MKDLAIIFDLDGTLLNTNKLIIETFRHTFKKYKPGYTLSDEELLTFLGPSLNETFSKYFLKEDINEIIDYYRDFNHSHHEDYVTVYPTVLDTIDYLYEEGYPLGIVTTKLKEAAYIGLDMYDLRKYFKVIIGGEDVSKSKPDPEGINSALSKLNTSKAVYVGDNVTDILAGKNANVYTIGVGWSPKGSQDLIDLKPSKMLNQMEDIIEFIKEVD